MKLGGTERVVLLVELKIFAKKVAGIVLLCVNGYTGINTLFLGEIFQMSATMSSRINILTLENLVGEMAKSRPQRFLW